MLLASVKVLVGYSWLVWPSLEPLLSNDKEGLGGFVANVANANQLETVLFFLELPSFLFDVRIL